MEFEWDQAKHAKTLHERGFGFDDAARIFARPVLIWEDARRDYGEVASGQWAKPPAMFSTSHLHGAAMRYVSSRCDVPAERKHSYGYHKDDV
jgi:uncharacterized DUF497 family protein